MENLKMKLQYYVPVAEGRRNVELSIDEHSVSADIWFASGGDRYATTTYSAKDVWLLFRKVAEHEYPRLADSRSRRMVFQELVRQYQDSQEVIENE